jgi:hypothetical protein
MAIGANNSIDRRLVELYKDKQTFCADNQSKLSPEKVLDSMQMIAVANRAYMYMNNKKNNTMKIA